MVEEEIKKRKEIKKFIIIATQASPDLDGRTKFISFAMSSTAHNIYDAAQKEIDEIMWDTWSHSIEIIEESIADKVIKRKAIKVEADIDLRDSSERTFGLAYR